MIVVSILMILSGLAIENLTEAKVRSTIARNQAEFHSMATAIESYRLDHNDYPRMAHYDFYKDPRIDVIYDTKVVGVLSQVVSTPVAYLSNAYMMDPFMEKADKAPMEERLYTYQDIESYLNRNKKSTFWPKAASYYGQWRLGGVGPDLRFDHGFRRSAQLPYDSTNGTISLGNIWWGQRGAAKECPPVPDLLGEL